LTENLQEYRDNGTSKQIAEMIKRTVPQGCSRLKTSKTVTHLSDVIDHHLQPCTNPNSETPNGSILEATKSQEFNDIEVLLYNDFLDF
jgi:hypothetical protein